MKRKATSPPILVTNNEEINSLVIAHKLRSPGKSTPKKHKSENMYSMVKKENEDVSKYFQSNNEISPKESQKVLNHEKSYIVNINDKSRRSPLSCTNTDIRSCFMYRKSPTKTNSHLKENENHENALDVNNDVDLTPKKYCNGG